MLQPHSFAVSRSFAFIDPTVPDLDTLLTGLEPGIEAHVLDSHRDGIAQIADILRGQTVEAIHILSHGAPGTIFLGNEAIDARTLRERYAHLLQTWAEALTPDGDILLYGCEVGRGERGADFLALWRDLTEANVAANGQCSRGRDVAASTASRTSHLRTGRHNSNAGSLCGRVGELCRPDHFRGGSGACVRGRGGF